MTHDATDDVRRARRHGLGDIPRRTARRFPTKTAVVDGDLRLTFTELDARVDQVAAGLHRLGVRKGDRVALLSHNCWQIGALSFGAARLGALLVPVNFMLNATEIAYVLDHSEALVLVTEDALVPTAEAAMAASDGSVRHRVVLPLAGEEPPGWTSFADALGQDGPVPDVDVDDDDPIRIMYTSGTESRPKGALLTSRALMWQYVSCIVDGEMTSSDVDVHSLPMYHCAQLDNFFSVAVFLGATSIIVRDPDPALLLPVIERERVTKLFLPPTVWIRLLQSPSIDEHDLSSLQKGYYGASAMPGEVLREMQVRFPQLRWWNLYGQTELASLASVLHPDEHADRPESAGRAVLNVETIVVDDAGAPAAPGEVGEIVHRSPQVTAGYFRDPAKTAEAFQGGWFHSGDLGIQDEDGFLRVVDRKKDMIKSGGENVASREVEEALHELEGVAEVAVVGMPHPQWVEAVVAFVVPRAGSSLASADVEQFARGRLAGYKRPKHVVVTEALPKNPSGKILKRDLREDYLAEVQASWSGAGS